MKDLLIKKNYCYKIQNLYTINEKQCLPLPFLHATPQFLQENLDMLAKYLLLIQINYIF